MKPTVMLLTVILLVIGTLFIAQIATPGSDHILSKVPVKKERTSPLPQPVYEEVTASSAAKLKLIKPKLDTTESEGDSISCGVTAPLPAEDYSDSLIGCILIIETEAEYPGGAAAWQRYLYKNMHFLIDSIDDEIQSSIMVQFVIDEEGNVNDVEAVSGPEALSAEAVRVIKKSGKWTPAIKEGRYVKSIKRQPFIICFKEE